MNPSSTTSVRPTKRRRAKAVRHVTEGDDELADGIIVKTKMKNTDNGQVKEMIQVPVWINEPAKDLPADPLMSSGVARRCSAQHKKTNKTNKGKLGREACATAKRASLRGA
jgi:hypothetical protein